MRAYNAVLVTGGKGIARRGILCRTKKEIEHG